MKKDLIWKVVIELKEIIEKNHIDWNAFDIVLKELDDINIYVKKMEFK